MLRPTAVEVYPEDNFTLRIVFDNHEVKLFDVKPYIRGEWYGELANESYFRAVKTDGYTVVWPDGQDLCPDELYAMGIPVAQIGDEQVAEAVQYRTLDRKYWG